MTQIPDSHKDIFEKKSFAHVATSDGNMPQVTPVWVEYDGEHILINSAKGRKKDRSIRANPNVAISVQDPDNPYRYIGLQGKVVEITEEGGTEHIHKLSRKYNGQNYPDSALAGPPRVIYKIAPTRVWTMG
ncbi:MAG: PPOX class F420-dependent oxidoreductase [Caldilineaceae bacterium]|nr:PPOX class F420-dependent oxidoreductase [Caldilineaceae bacterium]